MLARWRDRFPPLRCRPSWCGRSPGLGCRCLRRGTVAVAARSWRRRQRSRPCRCPAGGASDPNPAEHVDGPAAVRPYGAAAGPAGREERKAGGGAGNVHQGELGPVVTAIGRPRHVQGVGIRTGAHAADVAGEADVGVSNSTILRNGRRAGICPADKFDDNLAAPQAPHSTRTRDGRFHCDEMISLGRTLAALGMRRGAEV
jgi:hypothetical protein